MYMYLFEQVVGLIISNNVVNFNFFNMKIFLCCMLINLAYLNKYIYTIVVISFIISRSQLDILVVFSWSQTPPRHIQSTGPTNVYP
jgi:cytochrome bd-type quinol oxidase subunit 1